MTNDFSRYKKINNRFFIQSYNFTNIIASKLQNFVSKKHKLNLYKKTFT